MDFTLQKQYVISGPHLRRKVIPTGDDSIALAHQPMVSKACRRSAGKPQHTARRQVVDSIPVMRCKAKKGEDHHSNISLLLRGLSCTIVVAVLNRRPLRKELRDDRDGDVYDLVDLV